MKSRNNVNEDMEQHTENALRLQRSILTTKQVGNASEKIKANCGMVIRTFKKCESTTVVYSSKDDQVNIKVKTKHMECPLPEEELHFQTSRDADLKTDSSKEQ